MSKQKATRLELENVENPSRRRALVSGAAGTLVAASLAVPGSIAAAAAPKGQTKDYEGKCTFVTGGARGIGLASAEEMAKVGSNIVLFDVAENIKHVRYPMATRGDLDTAKAKIESHGVRCLTIKGDVRDRRSLNAAVQRAVSTFRSIDMLVVNAGVTHAGDLEAFSDEEVQTVIDINFGGAVKTIQAALPTMRGQGSGNIVVIASLLGRMGNEMFPVYAATKWAAIGLAKSTSLIGAPHNVTCNAICPTWVRTKLLDNEYVLNTVSPQSPTVAAIEAFSNTMSPLDKSIYEPSEIGRIVKFFGSPAAASITGEVFDVSAGMGARGVV